MKKTASKPKSRHVSADHVERIACACLDLAALGAWDQINAFGLAKQTKQRARDVAPFVRDMDDVPGFISAYFDRCLSAQYVAVQQARLSDSLFDIIMARFDLLQKHRAGIVALSAQYMNNKRLMHLFIRAQHKSMLHMLSLTGCRVTWPKDIFLAVLLMGVFDYTFMQWKKDSSKDLDKTMGCLGKALQVTLQHIDM